MTAAQNIKNGFWRWLDDVAEVVIALSARMAASRTVRVVQTADDRFVIQAADGGKSSVADGTQLRLEDGRITTQPEGAPLRGRRVELVLQPERLVFKPLELP